MKLLLDTHIWLWGLIEPHRLTRRVAEALEDPSNELWISPLSLWEVLILAERGRVVLEPDPIAWVRAALRAVPFHEATLNHEIAFQSRLADLPHQDPVDRFLVATAAVYHLTLVTADERLLRTRAISLLPNKG